VVELATIWIVSELQYLKIGPSLFQKIKKIVKLLFSYFILSPRMPFNHVIHS